MSKKSSTPVISFLGVILVTFVILEVVLQALAFGLSLKSSDASGSADGDMRTVVCLGDSYTYGVGASTPHKTSYPSRLESLLNSQEDGSWRVVNSGWPGRDSRGVLEVLDYHLLVEKPEILVVLIGINDTWGHPELLTLPKLAEAQAEHGAGGIASKGKFRLECRTLRLIKTFRGKDLFRDGEMEPAVASPAEAQGAVSEAAGQSKEKIASPLLEDFKVAEGVTVYELEPEPVDPASLKVFRRDQKVVNEVWELLEKSKLPEAEASALGISDSSEHLRVNILAEIYGKMGKRELEAAQLERAFEMAKNRELRLLQAENIASVFQTLNAFERGLPVLAEFEKKFPESVAVNQYYMQFLAALGKFEEAAAIGRRLIPMHEERGNEHWGAIECYRTYARVEKNPVDAIESILKAYAMNGEADEVADNIRGVMSVNNALDRAACDKAMARLPFTEEAKVQLAGAFGNAFGTEPHENSDSDADLEVMKSHLGQITQRCRDLDIKVLFHTYPFFAGDVIEVQKASAQGDGAKFMNTHQLFNEKVDSTGRPREEFFIADGHCNDDGYDIMAGLVYDALQDWVKK